MEIVLFCVQKIQRSDYLLILTKYKYCVNIMIFDDDNINIVSKSKN